VAMTLVIRNPVLRDPTSIFMAVGELLVLVVACLWTIRWLVLRKLMNLENGLPLGW